MGALARVLGGIAVAAGLLLPAAAAADPWISLHPLSVSSSVRYTAGGWLLAPIDADGDPILANPATTPALWASGQVQGGGPDIRLGFGAPVWSGRFTLRVEGRRDELARDRSTLAASETDVDGDGFSDILAWQRTASPEGSRGNRSHMAARAGMRYERWGFGLWTSYDEQEELPAVTHFNFPLTSVAARATGTANLLFDLETGDEISARLASSNLFMRHEQLRTGGDIGVRFGAVGVGLGLGWEQRTDRDRAAFTVEDRFLGDRRVISADRDLVREESALMAALRIDGRHDVGARQVVLWTAGMRLRRPLQTTWSGIEFLSIEAEGSAGDQITEWIRSPELNEAEAMELESRLAVGFADNGPDLAYGVGLTWRYVHGERTQRFRDTVQFRVDDPGVPGQRGRTFTRAEGWGDWVMSNDRNRHEAAIGAGGRYALTSKFGLLLGGNFGYRVNERRQTLRLEAIQDITGTEEVEPNVVNTVDIPFANFSVDSEDGRRVAETFQEVTAGFGFNVKSTHLAVVFRWDGLDHAATLMEGIIQW